MKAPTMLFLLWRVAAGQTPTHPPAVVVLPAAIRDSMSAIWRLNNRHWDEAPELRPFTVAPANLPTELRYVGCLTGHAAGDTVWVTNLVAPAGLVQRQFSVVGDCSNVPGLIGTWRTHPYRAGYKSHAVKERGLSGRELKKFGAAPDVVTIVVWDSDSLDAVTKGPDGDVQRAELSIPR